MAFQEVHVDVKTKAKGVQTGIAVGLARRGQTAGLMRITIREETFKALGYSLSDRFTLLLGTGEHHGILRLRKSPDGAVRATERALINKGLAYTLSLGRRTEFVDRGEPAQQCQWTIIDHAAGTLEIVLPKWAEETDPRKAEARAKEASRLAAAEKERQRLADERAEAERRRKLRGL
jgi:hypothetical protein